MSKCIRSNGAWETKILLLNDKVDCFVSWQGKQSKVSGITWPNWPVETKDFNRLIEICPKQ